MIRHDDVIKWKHIMRGIHRSPVNFPHKGHGRGALICAWIKGWVNNRECGDLRRHCAHYCTGFGIRKQSIARLLSSLQNEITAKYCQFIVSSMFKVTDQYNDMRVDSTSWNDKTSTAIKISSKWFPMWNYLMWYILIHLIKTIAGNLKYDHFRLT